MDFSWLGDLFGNFLGIFNPLKGIKHWKIWAELFNLYKHLKAGIDWYKAHVVKRMKALSQLEHQLFNTFLAPALKIIDTVRRLSGLVGLFNKGLATKLNQMFFRIEGYLLLPFNLLTQRLNQMQNIFSGFLTPLGFLDRATLLNSAWRDIQYLRQLLFDPTGAGVSQSSVPGIRTFDDSFGSISSYVQGQPSPIKSEVDAGVQAILGYMQQP